LGLKIPVLYSHDLVDLIPLVLDSTLKVPSGDKAQIRDMLKSTILESGKFFRKDGRRLYTRKGKLLRTAEDINKHLEKTWLDCYSLPACERFGLMMRNGKYKLTVQGLKLADAKRQGDADFKDALAQILIDQDQKNWKILRTLRGFPEGAAVTDLTQKLDFEKETSAGDYLRLFTELDLVRVLGKLYRLNVERYQNLIENVSYRSYEEVGDEEFMAVLHTRYRELRKILKTPYVPIEDLRTPVSIALKWREEYFTKRLEEIPLIVGNKQLLFSPRALARKGGVTRNRKYYNYLTVYDLDDSAA
jgi:hypothetical protein